MRVKALVVGSETLSHAGKRGREGTGGSAGDTAGIDVEHELIRRNVCV